MSSLSTDWCSCSCMDNMEESSGNKGVGEPTTKGTGEAVGISGCLTLVNVKFEDPIKRVTWLDFACMRMNHQFVNVSLGLMRIVRCKSLSLFNSPPSASVERILVFKHTYVMRNLGND